MTTDNTTLPNRSYLDNNESTNGQFESRLPSLDKKNSRRKNSRTNGMTNYYSNNAVESPRKNRSLSIGASQQQNRTWVCGTCTFGENSLNMPVCQICGAVPPERPPSPQPPDAQNPNNTSDNPITNNNISNGNNNNSSNNINNNNNNNINNNINTNTNTNTTGNFQTNKPNEKNSTQLQTKKSEEMTDPLEVASRNSISNLEVTNASQVSRTKKPPNYAPPNLNMLDMVSTDNPTFSIENKIDSHTTSDNTQDIEKEDTDKKEESPAVASDPNKMEKNMNAGAWKWGFWQRVVGNNPTNGNTEEDQLPSSINSINRTHSTSERPLHPKIELKDQVNAKDDSTMTETDWTTKYSIAQLPAKDAEKITRRLMKLETKKELQIELEKSIQKLETTLQQHAQQMVKLEEKLEGLKTQRAEEMKRWKLWHIVDLQNICRDYYANTIACCEEQIILEKLHIMCFREKLNKLKSALKKIRTNRRWNVEDVRQNVETAFHTAWKIRLSNDVPERQQKVALLKQVIESCRQEYDRQKNILGKKEISFEERQEKVVTFLRSVLNQYESQKMAKMKHYRLGKLSNENHYYHEFDIAEQKTFDSFILDQRTKEGRITVRWLKWLVQKQEEVTFESLCDFMVKLSHTFIDSYQLSKSQYYECVRIFVYRCVLGQPSTQDLISNITTSRFQDLNISDETYRRKTPWMRALKYDQLQINKEYWPEPDTTIASEIPQRRNSQVGIKANNNSGIPFGEAIAMIGELERHHDIYKSPDKGVNLILEAVKLINDTAMKTFENNKKLQKEKAKIIPLGNDELFPLVVYCVIQSRLEHPHMYIRFIELILPEENTTMGQAAFALSLLKAAVQYIVNAAPEEFGLDSSIDRVKTN